MRAQERSSLSSAAQVSTASTRPVARVTVVGSELPPADADLMAFIRRTIVSQVVDEMVVIDSTATSLPTLIHAVYAGAGRDLRLAGRLPDPAELGPEWREEFLDGRSTLVMRGPRRCSGALAAIKRLTDVVLSVAGMIIFTPVFLVVALLVKSTSPGPVFHRLDWRGYNGRRIRGYKFRTMVSDAEQLQSALLDRNEMSGPVFKIAADPRVTPLGRWLRKFSLDELPQLWSVVKGDLSLIGPRPALAGEYAAYALWHTRRLSVKPGMSCLWQVRGRNHVSDFDAWARLDLEYIDHWSLWLDLRVIAETVLVVLRGTGR